MINIRYGEYREGADIAGMTVAEARALYKSEWDMPDRAIAILNGQQIRDEMELRIRLRDNDDLIFVKEGGVEVIYDDHREVADLAGMTVAEARALYEPEWDIPDLAYATLNGRQIRDEMEPRVRLRDGDKLVFRIKTRKAAYLVAALLTALIATTSIFAYGYLTATITLVPGEETDFAKVETFTTPPAYTVDWTTAHIMGRYKGSVSSGDLFKITRNPDYTGDLLVKVYITNANKLVKGFQFLNMEIQLRDALGSGGNIIDKQYLDISQSYQLLTLENGVVTFQLQNTASPAYVYLSGGSYHSTPWGWAWIGQQYVSPNLYCEISQAEE